MYKSGKAFGLLSFGLLTSYCNFQKCVKLYNKNLPNIHNHEIPSKTNMRKTLESSQK